MGERIWCEVNRKPPVIMVTSTLLIFALVLFANSFARSTLALPAGRIKDDTAYQDISMMDEDAVMVAGPGHSSPRTSPIIEGRLVDEDGTKRIFILSVSNAGEGIVQHSFKTWWVSSRGFWMVKAVSLV